MLVETAELLTPRNAAWTAGVPYPRFQELVQAGNIKPFVVIDGLTFYHRAEVLALRRFAEAIDGRRPSKPLPKTYDLF
ncbi:hypothetical protein D3C72_1065710 [compost metagenome]|jgi:hypothetical protein